MEAKKGICCWWDGKMCAAEHFPIQTYQRCPHPTFPLQFSFNNNPILPKRSMFTKATNTETGFPLLDPLWSIHILPFGFFEGKIPSFGRKHRYERGQFYYCWGNKIRIFKEAYQIRKIFNFGWIIIYYGQYWLLIHWYLVSIKLYDNFKINLFICLMLLGEYLI